MRNRLPFYLLLLGWACALPTVLGAQQNSGPIRVEVRQTAQGGFALYRGGQPYYVRGAGGTHYLDELKRAGGNSIRCWGIDGARQLLDSAHSRGLTVTVGFWMGHERHGFDYNDPYAVRGQLEQFKQAVLDLKDHPAILLWAIGNEMDLFYTNLNMWNAVEDVARMIHETDPNHPTITITAGLDMAKCQLLRDRCPSIDILGVNTYGDLPNMPAKIRQYGWDRPYMITEWGPNGNWESPVTSWGAPMEANSFQKSEIYLHRYRDIIAKDTLLCIGSYVFLWGNKQETTSSWYGMFLQAGNPTATVDVMHYVWNGAWPANRAPEVRGLRLGDHSFGAEIVVDARQQYHVVLDASDPENRPLRIEWVLVPESRDRREGGDYERAPETLTGYITNDTGLEMDLRAPAPGEYRLFAFVYDEEGRAGTINTPFRTR